MTARWTSIVIALIAACGNGTSAQSPPTPTPQPPTNLPTTPPPNDIVLSAKAELANGSGSAIGSGSGSGSGSAGDEIARRAWELSFKPEVGSGSSAAVTTDGGAPDQPPPISSRVTIAVAARGPSSLAADTVLQKLQRVYVTAIKRCYVAALESDPKLTGKLEIAISVNASGHVAEATATGPVAPCALKLAFNWIFPAPTETSAYDIALTLNSP